MTEQSGLRPEERGATTLSRPPVEGGLRAADDAEDYRAGLRSRRWNAAPLRNPEVEKTDPRLAVLAIAVLSAITLIIIVIGYASGFWALPT